MKYEVTICHSYEIEDAIDRYDAMAKAEAMFVENPFNLDYFFDVNPIGDEDEGEEEADCE